MASRSIKELVDLVIHPDIWGSPNYDLYGADSRDGFELRHNEHVFVFEQMHWTLDRARI